MTWGEAKRLVTILRGDPSSATAAAIEGWRHPITREWLVLADLIDLQGRSKAGKSWKPYQRPWKRKQETERYGDNGGRSRAEVLKWLRSLGHNV